MKTISAAAVVPVVVLAVFTVWITGARQGDWRRTLDKRGFAITATGKPAPALSLPALDGHTVSLADYRGKNVVIAYWASWCSPCRAEMPALNRLYQRGRTSGREFEILAVSVDEDRAAAQTFVRETGMTYPVLLDPGQKTVDAFHVESVPSLVVVDPSGQIIFGRSGFDQRAEYELAEKLGMQGFRFGGMDGRRGN